MSARNAGKGKRDATKPNAPQSSRGKSGVATTSLAEAPHDHATHESLQEFREFRERMNKEILAEGNLVINRFFALDTRTYERGSLDVKTKELLGLVASLVLRCDDCVTYHLTRCAEEHVTRSEIFESLSVGLVVGGSIVIPHLRRAVDRWSELERIAT